MSSENDVLGKMDALMKRHQPADPKRDNIPMLTEKTSHAHIPVLTDIAKGTPASQPVAPAPMPEAPPSPGNNLNPQQLDQIRQSLQQHLGEIIEVAAAELVAQYKELLPQLIEDALQEALQKKRR